MFFRMQLKCGFKRFFYVLYIFRVILLIYDIMIINCLYIEEGGGGCKNLVYFCYLVNEECVIWEMNMN